jgi:hypothetical protein
VKFSDKANGGVELSFTVTVKGNDPAPDGVPLRTPPVLKLIDPGSVPELSDHSYGAAPLVTPNGVAG